MITKLFIRSLEAIIIVQKYTVDYVVTNSGQSDWQCCVCAKLLVTFRLWKSSDYLPSLILSELMVVI